MALSFKQVGNEWQFTNSDGTWSVWDKFTYQANRTQQIGPGYIGKMVTPGGRVIVDDFKEAGIINDPRYGGLGAVGWHNARRNGDPNVYNRTWDLTIRQDASTNHFGVVASRNIDGPRVSTDGALRYTIEVDLCDMYSWPNPIMTVMYDYKIEDSNVKQWITFRSKWDGSGPALYIKEPKIVAATNVNYPGGSRYRKASVYTKSNILIGTKDLLTLPAPNVGTWQIGDDRRTRMMFHDAADGLDALHIVAQAAPGSFSSTRVVWEGAPYGPDYWAQLANTRTIFENTGGAYCTQGPGGTLTRQWEVSKRPTEWNVDVMFHAWEGGSGYPDCLKVYRAWGPYGEEFTAYMDYSLGAGWQI
jgi:hypothetical protein